MCFSTKLILACDVSSSTEPASMLVVVADQTSHKIDGGVNSEVL